MVICLTSVAAQALPDICSGEMYQKISAVDSVYFILHTATS